jgi:hypothetical protein
MSSKETMKWNEFRSLHKGQSQAKISELYGLYKDGQYEIPTDATSVKEEVEETKAVKMKEAVKKSKTQPKVETTQDLISEYKRLSSRLTRFGRSMTEEVKAEAQARLRELAKLTAPRNYTCDPTDGWKLWTGPTQASLLVNETRRVAFRVRNYQGAKYVSYETVGAQETLDSITNQYARKKALVSRPPLNGVEIKLPQSAREVRLRGE